jgi:hypothetical protein
VEEAQRVAERRERARRPPAGRERIVNLVDGGASLAGARAFAAFAPHLGATSVLTVRAFLAA